MEEKKGKTNGNMASGYTIKNERNECKRTHSGREEGRREYQWKKKE